MRLARLKGSMPTFGNLCPKVECLTDRRFSYSHLVQIKFILRDAIQIRRVFAFDERTSFMKPDLHISINVDAIEIDGKLKSESGNMHLRKIFRARLADFSKSHPEVDEIPEDMLPEPFSRQKLDTQSSMRKIPTTTPDLSLEMPIEALGKQQLAVKSHHPRSFHKCFSKTSLQPLVVAVPESPLTIGPPKRNLLLLLHPQKNCCLNQQATDKVWHLVLLLLPPFCSPVTSCKELDASDNGNGSCTETANVTPAQVCYTPAKLMSLTPALHPPKRCYVSPEEKCASLPNKLIRRPPPSRSLKFDRPEKDGKLEDEIGGKDGSVDNEIFYFLPENLIQSVRPTINFPYFDPYLACFQNSLHHCFYVPI